MAINVIRLGEASDAQLAAAIPVENWRAEAERRFGKRALPALQFAAAAGASTDV